MNYMRWIILSFNKKLTIILDDKYRGMVYIQSSGGKIPWMLRIIMNRGLNYIEDIVKLMGIRKFQELLVDGTGTTKEEWNEAVKKAEEHIDKIMDQTWIIDNW